MNTDIYIPNSLRSAALQLRTALGNRVEELPKQNFVRAWCSVSYLYPGLHPDGFEDPDSGWPKTLKRFATEAWRRAEIGELSDEELYPSDAAWCGIYDRMTIHTDEEMSRRRELSEAFGRIPDA
jgi:hypothetical protein